MTDSNFDPPASVANGEILYRAVFNDARMFPTDGQGVRRISSMTFNDTMRRPSVDRDRLCPNGAVETQARFAAGSSVLSLVTEEVRQITTTHGITGQVYGVDVEPVPLLDNIAHAEIFGRPPFDTDKVFERVKQALARIAIVALSANSS